MTFSGQVYPSPNAHGKRPLEADDSHGGGSTKFKLRRVRPVNSARDFRSDGVGNEAVAEDQRQESGFVAPTPPETESNRREPGEIGDDSDQVDDDCVIIDDSAPPPETESNHLEPGEIGGDSDQDDNDCVIIDDSVKGPGFFDWVETGHQAAGEEEDDIDNQAAAGEEGADNQAPAGNAAGEEDDDDNQAGSGEEDADYQAPAGEEDADNNQANVDDESEEDDRRKVLELRKQFQELYEKLSQEYEEERNGGPVKKRCASKAAMILKKEKKCLNSKAKIGRVPGVKIGDRFKFRSEIAIIGLHTEFNNGISTTKIGNKEYAVSVVEAGRYNNKAKPFDKRVLIYSGHGGNIDIKVKTVCDQVLQGGNLAMKNSIDSRYPVRVIRKIEVKRHTYEYFYDGLYNVTEFWPETSHCGKTVFMFKMIRKEGQPVIDYLGLCSKSRRHVKKSVS